MALYATSVSGDQEVMLRCVVQEYAWMGWDAERILRLFRDPFYPALHELWRAYGEDAIRQRVASVLDRTSGFRIDVTLTQEDSPPPGSELVEIAVPPHLTREASSPNSESRMR
ncbi:MAG: hypothetical protein HY000_03930 [Planctomycetes bacterium]|nr:hypothetical protein [Planctomycetota bacterium]